MPRRARRWPSGSSPRATAASSRCSTARTICSTLAGARRDRALRGGRPARWSVAPTTSRSWRARSRRRTTPSGSTQVRRALEDARHHRGVRHRRWHPGAPQLHRRRRVVPLVYAHPDVHRDARTSTPIEDHVRVDFELRGCPVDKGQLVEVVTALLAGREPQLPTPPRVPRLQGRGTTCVLVAPGVPCLGPVTAAGCGALCPACGRGCFGCFGPSDQPNTDALSARFRELGLATTRSAGVRLGDRRRAGVQPGQPGRLRPPGSGGGAPMTSARVPRRRKGTGLRPGGVADPRRGRGRRARAHRRAHVADVQLRIYEPPRFFEAFLRGRQFREAPDITARICGICPVAYQMSAVHALEEALGIDRSTARCARCGACCTAASGSRATRSTSTCCTRPTSSATRAASPWRRSPRDRRLAGCG